jgi:PAS domain S-box-containing protein
MTAEAAGQVPPGEAGFQLLADELPDVIIAAFDPQLMMWAATGGGLRGHGWTAEDFVGRELPRIAGSSQAEAVEACARAALGGLCTELEMNGYEETRRLWSITFVPLADAAGVVSGGMALCRDITEQRRAEELLRASQHQLAVAQRIAEVGSWDWDLATDELALSDELCRIFGLAPGSKVAMGPVVELLIHPADLERVKGTGPDAQRPGPLRPSADLRTDGTVRTVMARGEGVVGEDGQVERFIGTEQDITERRRADAERAGCSTGSTRPRRARTGGWPPTCTTGTSRAWPRSGSSWSRPGCASGPADRPRSTSCSGRSPRTCRQR